MKKQVNEASQSFKAIPKDYASLCARYIPRPIHDECSYQAAQDAVCSLAGYEDHLSDDQSDYLEAVSTFIEQYERQTVRWPKRSPKSKLKHLLEEHGMSGAELARCLGMNESMGGKILRGERNLTVEHIRSLSDKFSVSPELFIA